MSRVSIVLLILVIVFGMLLFTGRGADNKNSRGRTVDSLRAEWESLREEADAKLAADFRSEYKSVIRAYKKNIILNPEFRDTVFPQKAYKEIIRISGRAEPDISASAVAETEKKRIRDPAAAQKRNHPSGPVSHVRTEKTTDIPGTTADDRIHSTAQHEATNLYNRACKAFEEEEYRTSAALFRNMRKQYGKSRFYRLHAEAIADYTARARLLSENPSVCLYYYENFEYGPGSWKEQYHTSNCFEDSNGCLKGVSSHLGNDRDTHAVVTIVPRSSDKLFTFEKGQKLNFCFYVSVWAPVHVQILDSRNQRNYYCDIKDAVPGDWRAVSLPLSRLKRAEGSGDRPEHIEGECGYISFSAFSEKGPVHIFIDEVSVTGKTVPSYITKLITGQDSSYYLDAGSDLGTDGYLFNKTIIAHWKKRLNPHVSKGSFIIVGDAMREWVYISSPIGSNREILDHRVQGKHKRTCEIAASIENVLKEKRPEVVVVVTGLFDLMYPAEGRTVGSSVEKILRTCSSFGSVPVLLGLPKMWDKKKDVQAGELNKQFLKYSRTYRTPFVDTQQLFSGPDEKKYYTGPAVLSARGKKKLAQVLHTLYNKIQIYIFEKG